MKVEYSEIRKEDESDKPTIKIKTEIPGLKTQIFKPKESMGVKTEVVTTQGQESPLRNSEPQTISNVKVPEFSRGIYISQRTLKKTKEFYDLRKKGNSTESIFS